MPCLTGTHSSFTLKHKNVGPNNSTGTDTISEYTCKTTRKESFYTRTIKEWIESTTKRHCDIDKNWNHKQTNETFKHIYFMSLILMHIGIIWLGYGIMSLETVCIIRFLLFHCLFLFNISNSKPLILKQVKWHFSLLEHFI